MISLSEFLAEGDNQRLTLSNIITALRKDGLWGSRGLFVQISSKTGFSPAYIGQVLTGKKPLTAAFVTKISEHTDIVPLALVREDSGIPILTYPQLADLLKKTVSTKGQRAVARDSGIALLSIQRYLNGGLPSLDNLRKLTRYFGVKAIIS